MGQPSRPCDLFAPRFTALAFAVYVARAAAVAAVCVAVHLSASPLGAQRAPAGAIAGTVSDLAGTPIVNADLSLGEGLPRGTSDGRGSFRLPSVPAGEHTLLVRRLGFEPLRLQVTVAPRATAQVTARVRASPQDLEPVVVRGGRAGPRALADFHERRQRSGSGRFITREQIEKEDPMRLTDLFRSIPGVRIVPSIEGGSRVRLRSASASDCVPYVWVDGIPMGAGEFDLDALVPGTVEGIEVYSGVSGVPPQFMGTRGEGTCGAIVVWSGFEERRAKRAAALRAAGAGMGVRVNLETLRAELEAFEAEDVDEPARLRSDSMPTLAYPDSLLRARVAGTVLVAFVVDTAGAVAMETVDILATTHPLFAVAVRDMLASARYAPARRDGRAVPQVVQQPVRFSPTSAP